MSKVTDNATVSVEMADLGSKSGHDPNDHDPRITTVHHDSKEVPIKEQAQPVQSDIITDFSKVQDDRLTQDQLLLKYPKPKVLEQDYRDRNIEERASCLDYFTFSFMQPLISLGYRRTLTESDMPKVTSQRSALLVAPVLEKAWEEVKVDHQTNRLKKIAKAQKEGLPASSIPATQPSFAKAIWKTLTTYAIVLSFLQLAIRVEQTFEPIVLEKILIWLTPDMNGIHQKSKKWGFIYGAILVAMTIAQIFVNNYFYHLGFQLYSRMRSAVCALIYTKALKITVLEDLKDDKSKTGKGKKAPSRPEKDSKDSEPEASGEEAKSEQKPANSKKQDHTSGTSMSTGQIVNLMSVDADKIGMMVFFGWSALFVPIQIAVSLWLLYDTIGYSMFVGFGVIIVFVPVIFILVIRTSQYTQGRMAVSDHRVKQTNELLQGIRIVKFYAWEYFFQKELTQIRDEELTQIFKTNLFSGLTMFVFTFMVNLFSVAVFVVYSYVQDSFNAATIFKGVAYINSLQAPLFQLPNSIATILMGLISTRRVQNFLCQPEVDSMKAITSIQPLAHRKHQRKLLQEAADKAGMLPYPDAVADTELEGFNTSNYNPDELINFDSFEEPVNPENSVELNRCSFTWKSVVNEIGDPDVIGDEDGNVIINNDQEHERPSDQLLPKYLKGITPSQKNRLDKVPVVLKDIDFNAMKGKLTAVVGPVGSGKSSLLAGILGEIDVVYGSVARDKQAKIAYVAQSAWIQTKSIRENITFGSKLTSPESIAKYNRTLDVCALRQDLEVLEAGDETEIGDRGINLSGGQKQRVAIARAVFTDADLYLFDDPLSAVDAHVAEHIFGECVERELAGKTRILVMNQLHFLPRCDYIYVLDSSTERRRDFEESNEVVVSIDAVPDKSKESTIGIIAERGTYAELSETGEHFKELMKNYRESIEQKNEEELLEDQEAEADSALLPILPSDVVLGEAIIESTPATLASDSAMFQSATIDDKSADEPSMTRKVSYSVSTARSRLKDRGASYSVSRSSRKRAESAEIELKPANIGGVAMKKGQQIEEEELATGTVSLKLYWQFFSSMGKTNFFILLISSCIAQAAVTWIGLMLGYWADRKWNKEMNWYRELYIIILCISLVFSFFRSWYFAKCTTHSSSKFHGGLLNRVLRANSGFFDVTPAGRILNRFSKDLDAIDTLIPQTLLHTIVLSLQLLAAVGTCAALYPYFTIALVVIAVLFYFLQTFYSPAAIQVQRIESNTRSPLFQHFSESLKGIATIRAFNRVPQFQIENFEKIDRNSGVLYWVRMVYRWGGLRVGFLQCTLIFVSVLLVVITRESMDVGMAGVVLTYMLSISNLVGFLVMMSIELAGRMNSVERLQHYTDSIPQEASLDHGVDDFKPPESWPSKGVIEYRNVKMSYRPDLPPVIHNLSFLIDGQTKVGVVGRTGSGKSSLMMLLLRLYEIQKGHIFIDGVDISQLSLHDLRTKIGIVPQDAVLFSGTLRSNLDPFNQHTDEEIMDSLAAVNLDEFVQRLPGMLSAPVHEFGANFSQGQRQLLCLSRVLLKKPKILLLDEATSSVDSETDSLLQRAIVERFSETTQLTIAHRLNTVMNSDKIIVLDKGELAEYDSPSELVKDPTPESESQRKSISRVPGKGIFSSMYKAYLQHNN